MLHIASSSPPYHQNVARNHLARLRRAAKARGFRILRDGCGGFSLIDVKVEPPRPLLGCDHQQLWVIEQVILTPLPELPPRRKRMARHPAGDSFLSLVEMLKAQGGAS